MGYRRRHLVCLVRLTRMLLIPRCDADVALAAILRCQILHEQCALLRHSVARYVLARTSIRLHG